MKLKCNTCGFDKSESEFGIVRQNANGRNTSCRLCVRERNRAYAASDAGKKARDRINRGSGRYTLAKCNARRRGIVWQLSRDQFTCLTSKPCEYCGGKLSDTGCGLDRMDNNIGYVISNVVPCCRQCNNTKSNFWTHNEMVEIGTVMRLLLSRR